MLPSQPPRFHQSLRTASPFTLSMPPQQRPKQEFCKPDRLIGSIIKSNTLDFVHLDALPHPFPNPSPASLPPKGVFAGSLFVGAGDLEGAHLSLRLPAARARDDTRVRAVGPLEEGEQAPGIPFLAVDGGVDGAVVEGVALRAIAAPGEVDDDRALDRASGHLRDLESADQIPQHLAAVEGRGAGGTEGGGGGGEGGDELHLDGLVFGVFFLTCVD